MHTPAKIQAAIAFLRLHNPDAVRLAELVSLAARIEPELLRAVRLELTPFDAAAEADLWFSPLVETRTADWIALGPAAARELRSALVTDRSSLAAAHALIRKAHAGAPATIILEEEILWLALSGRPDAAKEIESRLRLVLGKLLEDPSVHRGLAHWFAGAAQRLPEEAQATEAYALLYFVTSGLLDGRRINAPQPALTSIDTLASAWPASIPRLYVWATLSDYGLTLRPEKAPGFVQLELPRTDPLLFEMRPLRESHQFITLRRGETKTFQIRSREVDLRTAAGDAYRLRRRPQQQSSSGLQNLIIGFGGTGAHVLTALKELAVLKNGRVPENIRFLLFDVIADWQPGKAMQMVGGAAEEKTAYGDDEMASLDPLTEYFQLGDFPPDFRTHVFEYLSPTGKPDAFSHMKDWLHAPWFSGNISQSGLEIRTGAGQQRQIARYAMFKNAPKIVANLQNILRQFADRSKGQIVSIWLIGSAAGGTGAGCLIDAAYLTRLAAGDIHLLLNGVVVLPNVYSNVRGIDQGRAYSLLRELDRVQEQGIPPDDRYVDMDTGRLISSRVVYDQKGTQVAAVSSRLFDDLFYFSRSCSTEDERRNFFTSAASAIDPYIDTKSGPLLLESMLSENGAVSSIGAARVYVPTETLKELFAWEQVAEYLRRAGAPKESDDRVEGLHVGLQMDRVHNATETFTGLLELFNALFTLQSMSPRARQSFARNELESRLIVNVWYELTDGSRTADDQQVLMTYLDPCYSLTEEERPKHSREWQIKTYKENAATGGIKETQDDSRARFADQLEEITRRYLSLNGGMRTFDRGRKYVIKTVAGYLQKNVDDIFIKRLMQRRWEFAQVEGAPEQGTALTQLFGEVQFMLDERGPLRKAYGMIRELQTVVGEEQAQRYQRYTHALEQLRVSRKPGLFSFGAWVEEYQQAARDACSAYIRWYQKHELLRDMQQLILNVESRLREWERLLNQLFDDLVRRESSLTSEASALFTVTHLRLRRTVQERLYRVAHRNDTLISFGSQPDPQMHGYQETLRNQSARGLAADLLARSHWEASSGAEGRPTISLIIDSPELTQQRYSVGDIRSLPNELYQFFHRRIDLRLSSTDVFDYLLWLQTHRDIQPHTIVKLLNDRATALIDTGWAPEIGTLVYREPLDNRKKEWADSLVIGLPPLQRLERYHSDPNSITLIKAKKPSVDQIEEVNDCKSKYLTTRTEALNNNEAHDQKLRHAQVFHPFRPEMEAWYIERHYLRNQNLDLREMLPPRVVRLLEDPEMMQLFIHGIATFAIEKIRNDWVWHAPDGDLMLTNSESARAGADVIDAAINFVLRQGEARFRSTRRISRKDVKNSISQSARRRGLTVNVMLEEFVRRNYYSLVDDAPPELRLPLKMIVTFYCNPNTRTRLQFRMDL